MSERCSWTVPEEDALITILQEIVVIGGRGDNGSFRPGTYEQIVLKLRKKSPDIKVTTKHVQNKIKRLKEKFSAAYGMVNTSGFGWDEAGKCVVVDSPEILDEYLKKNPTKSFVPNKPFLAYERLAVVFGKDRATGSNAESAADAASNVNTGTSEEGEPVPSPISNPPNNASSSNPNAQSGTNNKRKFSGSEEVTKIIEKGLATVSEQMQKMTKAIASSTNDLSELGTIHEELKTMDLSPSQIMQVCLQFTKNLNLFPMWKSLDAATKPNFAKAILEDNK